MYHSLDRLIALAQKTGDRLIVHDPVHGNDVVIMDVDSYERLALGKEETEAMDEPWDTEDDWHSAGSILEERQKQAMDREPWTWEPPLYDDMEPPASEARASIPPETMPEPNEWKEEPLSGDEPVFYEEPV